MPPSGRARPHTVDSPSFDPDLFFEQWEETIVPHDNDLKKCIVRAFKLKPDDEYEYHAIATVTLDQVQTAINAGGLNGMHAWYRDENGAQIPPPPSADVDAYTQIFSSTTQTTKALTSFGSNAKKGSIRAEVAAHLQSKLFLDPSSKLTLPNKQKTPSKNPYYDLWLWSCHSLEWAGPISGTVSIKFSHHILPVFYHHFGCICPTYDALRLLHQLSTKKRPDGKDKEIVEIGSGNGYWAYLLRRQGLAVHCVDNLLSAWRTMWVGDTITSDGVAFLKSPPARLLLSIGKGARDAILLLVYPHVSAHFTANIINSYEGDTIIVAGTQNGNGFTGFKDEVVDAWMAREKKDFRKAIQIPLPSFAGKDEALFVFIKEKIPS